MHSHSWALSEGSAARKEHVFAGASTLTHTCTYVPGAGKAAVVTPAPDRHTHSVSCARRHPHTQAAAGGWGRCPSGSETQSSARPVGSLQMPGVILSLDQWAIFGDTGLGGGEQRRQEARALLWRETPGPGRAAWKLGCSRSTPPCPAHGWVPGVCSAE